ncbi:hypothetical protein GT348_07130 [Aristophania vespae]|uniref:Uncharacterized protein n=1 Tax=Aristophania vespae TaxID=2697033 RepID=A0A6P1NCJ7_9PROT|nr:hypothetical protein [Aristophania vespae]QHI96036.1 hypothetical protein GT348_07130 [Aristophania vespae]UMM63804.1 hypothetical protein DM15PD_07810 [Aristophania vespae]
MKEGLSIMVLGLSSLMGLVWLSWRAAKTATEKENAHEARKSATLIEQASQAAANKCNTDSELEESLENGTF